MFVRIAILCCCALWLLPPSSPGDEIAEKLMLSTYKLANDSSTATCFAVHRVVDGKIQRFVVTAAHVFEQMAGDTCQLISRHRIESGQYQRREIQLTVRTGGGQKWKRDQSHDVAVLAIPDAITVVSMPYECLATEEALTKIHAGDNVRVAVFPERSEANPIGFPVLRGGSIASFPLRPVESFATFFVDTNAWKGDSGGAIMHATLRYRNEWPMILGVTRGMQNITDTVKESRYVERKTDYPLGLSVVVHAVFARRLIESAP